MDTQTERQCRVTGAILHQGNSTLCPFLTDGATRELLPVMPGLIDKRQQRFLERELEAELYFLYQQGKLPDHLQRQYAEDNRELEEQERLVRRIEDGVW